MSKAKKWLAVVRDEHWTLAKVLSRKGTLHVLRLSELELGDFVPTKEAGVGGEPVETSIEAGPAARTGAAARDAALEPAARLKLWLRREKVPLKQLRLAVSYLGVITRIIVLPKMSAKDLHILLTEHVDQYFTLNIEDYVVDYRVIEHFTEEEQERQKVLLAALPKPRWERFYQICLGAGFKPEVVDLAADSTLRLYANLGQRRDTKRKVGSNEGSAKVRGETPGIETRAGETSPIVATRAENVATVNAGKGSDWAIVDLNAGRVEFILLEQGKFFLYSDMELALESVVDELYEYKIIRQRECAPEVLSEGERLRAGELVLPGELLLENRQEFLRVELETALLPVLRTLEEFFNFFAARHFGKSIDQVFITGGYSDLPFLEELFTDNLGIEAQIGFPRGWRPRFKKKVRAYEEQWMRHASLYGLAFRED